MFKVRYKGKILTVYHVEPKPVLQFLVYTDKQGVFKSGNAASEGRSGRAGIKRSKNKTQKKKTIRNVHKKK